MGVPKMNGLFQAKSHETYDLGVPPFQETPMCWWNKNHIWSISSHDGDLPSSPFMWRWLSDLIDFDWTFGGAAIGDSGSTKAFFYHNLSQTFCNAMTRMDFSIANCIHLGEISYTAYKQCNIFQEELTLTILPPFYHLSIPYCGWFPSILHQLGTMNNRIIARHLFSTQRN